MENDNYQFILNNDDTHFTLLDKKTNKSYNSRPENLTKADTLTVYYSGSLGTPTKYGNYNYSINYEKQHRYAIRCIENSIEVLYLLGGKVKIDYTDFPQLLDQEKYEINILQKATDYVNALKESKDPNYLTYSFPHFQLFVGVFCFSEDRISPGSKEKLQVFLKNSKDTSKFAQVPP